MARGTNREPGTVAQRIIRATAATAAGFQQPDNKSAASVETGANRHPSLRKKVRAFGAFEAKWLFSAPPSPICDRENAPMTDMQDQIHPTHCDLKA
jgi:hypothetical protein